MLLVKNKLQNIELLSRYQMESETSSDGIGGYYDSLVEDKPSKLLGMSMGPPKVDPHSSSSRYRFIPTAFAVTSVLACFFYYHRLTRQQR